MEPEQPNDLILKSGDKIYIRPIGSHQNNTLVMFEMGQTEEGQVYVYPMMNPFRAVTVNVMEDLFVGPKVYMLDKLAESVNESPLTVIHTNRDTKTAFAKFLQVDTKAKTLTIRLAKGAEVFIPEREPY